jgi:MGT family glycosyltransferase
MTRFLFTTWEGGGNLPPVIDLARQLTDRGHAVRLMSDEAARADAGAAGLAFRPWTRAPNRPDRSRASDPIRDWEAASPPEGIGRLLAGLITGQAGAYAADLKAELAREPADLVVSSEMLPGVMAACESLGQPLVLFAANLCLYPLDGMPVFGPGLPPPTSDADRAMHDDIRAATHGLFDQGLGDLNAARAGLGLSPLTHVTDQVRVARAYLLGTSRAFDFPADPPALIRYVGAQLGELARPWTSPFAADDARPLVLVGFSTTFQNHARLAQATIDALARLPVRAVVTLGGLDAGEVRPATNVALVESAPHGQLMAAAALVVTHGGHGTVMRALAHGLPMLVIPHGRDQDENAIRVAHRGAGLSLPPTAGADDIEAALRRLIADPAFAARARALGEAIRQEGAAPGAADQLEALAAPAPAARPLPATSVPRNGVAFIGA